MSSFTLDIRSTGRINVNFLIKYVGHNAINALKAERVSNNVDNLDYSVETNIIRYVSYNIYLL